MALEYFKWSPCKLIRRTSSTQWTVLDAGPYTVYAAAYDDPSWADVYDGKNLGAWGYDSVTQQYTWIPNDLGKALLSTLGKKTTMFRVRRYSQPATNPNNTILINTLNNYINVVDVYSKGEGSSSSLDPAMEYNNDWGDMCKWIAATSGFQMYIPIYRSDGYLYTCIYLHDAGVDPNRYVSTQVARYLLSSALPATGLTPTNPANPYPSIPDSGVAGGGGSGTDTSDSNPVPLLPSVSAIGTGMCRLYNPTVAQLIDLGAWLWGSGLDLTQLKKIFSDPMDVILGCSVFPVSMPTETTPQTIIFGNIDSQISSRVVSSQYTSYDLGQIDVTSYYNSYLDFSPYTKMQIYLPFIGMKSINVDEFMSTADVAKRIGVTYSIDLLSGACVAHIYLNVGSTSTLLYEFGGTCNTQIPLNSRDYTATVQSLLGIVGGSAAAGVAAFMLPEAIPAVVGAAGVVGGMVMNAAKNTVASKPTVEHAGGIGGSTGIMGSRKAYLIIERPNLCHPENQEHFTGYPGFLYRTVNQLNGYTKFINFELQNIHATEPELEEIKEWFTVKGVLL